ncbi:hypothetical protein Aperf_G00000050452 [Anoplocephala perfoliata]
MIHGFPLANTGLIEFSCGECGKSFDLVDDLQSHIDQEHEIYFVLTDRDQCNSASKVEDENTPAETPAPEGPCFSCEFCGKEFPDRNKQQDHIYAIHETSVVCFLAIEKLISTNRTCCIVMLSFINSFCTIQNLVVIILVLISKQGLRMLHLRETIP